MTSAILLLYVLALTSLSPAESRAQEPPSTEKAALIKELAQLMGAGANAESIMNSVASQLQKESERIFEQSLSNLEFLSEKEREDLIRKRKEESARLDRRVMELFREKIDFNRIVDEVIFEVYDKHYTADELKDLIAFYKTTTGQKSIRLIPQLFSDSLAKTSEKLRPQLLPIITQIMEEERQRIEKALPAKPKSKRSPRRRG